VSGEGVETEQSATRSHLSEKLDQMLVKRLTVKAEAGTTPPKKNEEEPSVKPTLSVLPVLLLASIPPPTPRDPAQPLVGALRWDDLGGGLGALFQPFSVRWVRLGGL
jgi:hypothetical protein